MTAESVMTTLAQVDRLFHDHLKHIAQVDPHVNPKVKLLIFCLKISTAMFMSKLLFKYARCSFDIESPIIYLIY